MNLKKKNSQNHKLDNFIKIGYFNKMIKKLNKIEQRKVKNMIDKSLGNLLELLRRQALKDGVITDDEDSIIASATWNVAKLLDVVEKAEEDGVITPKESEEIDFFLAQIKRDPEILANRDGIITNDEAALLKIISKIIGNFSYESE